MLSAVPKATQRQIAQACDLSTGTVNKVLKTLVKDGLVSNGVVMESGRIQLENFRVNNAVILTSSTSQWLEPISLERPEGLVSVKGERLIDRLINQLREVGIDEVVLVVGATVDKYLYLREKYGVKLIINNEYQWGKTLSGIYAARDYLNRSYILKSDNYYPKNPFHHFEYFSYVCVAEKNYSGDDEEYPSEADRESWSIDDFFSEVDNYMVYGHLYLSGTFCYQYKPILEKYVNKRGDLFSAVRDDYLNEMSHITIRMRKLKPESIVKIGSLSDLYSYDRTYAISNDIKIFDNICKALKCQLKDITYISPLLKGMNNKSYKFYCEGVAFVYRHPGKNAENNLIDRHKEAKALRTAKALGIDNTLIYVNEDEGWKISRFIRETEPFDFRNKEHSRMLAEHLHTMHSANVILGFPFDYREGAERMVEEIREDDLDSYEKITDIRQKALEIMKKTEADHWQVSMCHNDIYEPNILVENDMLYLIDWEFAGDTDIGYDICKLFAPLLISYEDVDEWLMPYYGRETTFGEKKHLIACAFIQYYYWFIWAIFAQKTTPNIMEYMMLWYDRMMFYLNEYNRMTQEV